MSIFKRLVLLVLLAVLPLLAVEVYNAWALHRQLTNEVAQSGVRLAAGVVAEQARLNDSAERLLTALDVAEAPAHADFCSRMVPTLAAGMPAYMTLYVVDANGGITCASRPGWVGHKISERTGEVTVDSGLRVSTAVAPHALTPGHQHNSGAARHEHGTGPGQQTLILLETPTRGTGGPERIGVALSEHWIDDFARATHVGPAASILLVKDTGLVLHAPHGTDWAGRTVPPAWRRLLKPGPTTVARFPDLNGVPSLHAISPLSPWLPGLYVDVDFDTAEALAPVDAAARRSAILWFAALALTAAAIVWGGRRYVRAPIGVLLTAVHGWQRGDRSTRARLATGTEELRQLGDAFDTMAEAIDSETRERALAMKRVESLAGKLSSILESTTDAVVEVDRQWRLTYLNPQAAALLSNEREVIGQKLWEKLPIAGIAPKMKFLRAAMDTRTPAEVEAYSPSLGKWLHIRAFPAGAGLSVFLRDITGTKAAEEEARRSTELLEKVMALMPVGVWVLDRQGAIVQDNPAARRLWRCAVTNEEPPTLGGCRGWRADTGQRMGPADWPAARALATGETIEGEMMEIECLEGRHCTALNSAFPLIGEDGQITGAIVVCQDVTPLRETEKALRQAKDAADRANASKSKFFAAASHDLRQPVQSLFLLMDVLGTKGGGDPAFARVIDNMRNAARALRAILDELMEIAGLEVGGIEVVACDFPLMTTIGQLQAEYAPRCRAKGLELRVAETSAWVRTDPQLLARMLRNLLENAMKYTERGKILLGCRRRGERVVIQVADTGVGMPADKLAEIWDEFVQLDNPARDRRRGLGLGLSIVRRLAEVLGLTVGVRSRLDHGSVFSIDLPRAEPAAAAIPPARPEGGETGTVLAVDDDPLVLEGLKAALELAGHQVITAESEDDALRRLEDRKPDVMVVDYRLKLGANGIDVIADLRRSQARDIPAILLTGDTTPDVLGAARRCGYGILKKPVQVDELNSAIASRLRRAG